MLSSMLHKICSEGSLSLTFDPPSHFLAKCHKRQGAGGGTLKGTLPPSLSSAYPCAQFLILGASLLGLVFLHAVNVCVLHAALASPLQLQTTLVNFSCGMWDLAS